MDASPPPERAKDSFARAAPFLLGGLIALVFANAANGIFVFDDVGDILTNPSAKADSFLARLGAMNRPLTKATYALQDALHGPWAAGFHAVNVALHVAAAIMALAIVRRALRFAGGEGGTGFAFAVVALWAVHPALTESVTYVSGRSMALSSCFILGMMLAASGDQRVVNRLLAFACALLAPLARETALVAPMILVWWQLSVQPREPIRVAVQRFWPAGLGAFVAAAIILMTPRHSDLIAESLRLRPPLEAMRGNVHAAFDILGYWLTPWRATIDPASPFAWPWDDTRTLAKLGLFASLAAAAVILRRRLPILAFGLGLALLALSPSNTLLWRADPVSLKPLYLGGLGLTLAVAAAAIGLAGCNRAARTFVVTLWLFAAVVLGFRTMERNALFADDIALWSDAATKAPDYGRPWIMLGYAYFNAGRYAEAEAALSRGADLDPLDEKAAHVLRLARDILGRPAR